MTFDTAGRVAILWPGDAEARHRAEVADSRYCNIAAHLRTAGLTVEAAVYADEFADEIREQLLKVDLVLVWVNPIHAGRDRSRLDAMLRDVSAAGIGVSAHPDMILKMGTKEVLYHTQDIAGPADVDLYTSLEDLRERLAGRLACGEVRVLKQYRGNSGNGVWKIERFEGDLPYDGSNPDDMQVRVRHALRGATEERVRFGEFVTRCEPYFTGDGRMIDQPWQDRLADGMTRCYFVHDHVEGFGFQAINALYPAASGSPPQDAPEPGPRLYFPADTPSFQALKQQLEGKWIPALLQHLDIEAHALPLIWDADFLFGPPDAAGRDSHVLCEINVSSVFPFPDSALQPLAASTRSMIQARQQTQRSYLLLHRHYPEAHIAPGSCTCCQGTCSYRQHVAGMSLFLTFNRLKRLCYTINPHVEGHPTLINQKRPKRSLVTSAPVLKRKSHTVTPRVTFDEKGILTPDYFSITIFVFFTFMNKTDHRTGSHSSARIASKP